MTREDYAPLITKIRSRVHSWTACFLSFPGRLQLLTSVLTSLINFWIAAYRLPNRCITEIESICSAFLWSGPDLRPRKSKVAWRDVCKPKAEGGLGLKNIRVANDVCILRLLWRVLSTSASLWSRWIHANLIRDSSIWAVKEPTSQSPGSWMWKKILKMRNIAKGFVQVEAHNGKKTHFWFDRWSDLGYLIDHTGPRGFIDLGIPANSSLKHALDIHRRRRHRVPILNSIEEMLEEARRGYYAEQADVVLWRSKPDQFKSLFVTKNTWNQLRESRQHVPWWKGIWFSHNTPKHAFHAWVTILDRLPTGERMQHWNTNVSPVCVLCQNQLETRSHLYFMCPYSSHVWTNLARGLLQNEFTLIWEEILPLLTTQGRNRVLIFTIRYLFQTVLYFLWREQNDRRHEAGQSTPQQLINFIHKTMKNRFSSIRNQGDTQYEGGLQLWLASRPSY